jgi:hypothetical protein
MTVLVSLLFMNKVSNVLGLYNLTIIVSAMKSEKLYCVGIVVQMGETRYAVVDRRQGVVLLFGSWLWGNNSRML